MVSQLFDLDLHCWKSSIIHELFNPNSAQAILSIPLPYYPKKELLMWALNSKGIFFVKSAYRVLIEQDKSSNPAGVPWKKLWKSRLPERVKMLIWRLGSNALPTKDNLMKRLANVDPTCIFSKEKLESGVHLCCECPVTKAIWFSSCWGFRLDSVPINAINDLAKLIIEPPASILPAHDHWLITLKMALTMDEIWQLRNRIVYQEG